MPHHFIEIGDAVLQPCSFLLYSEPALIQPSYIHAIVGTRVTSLKLEPRWSEGWYPTGTSLRAASEIHALLYPKFLVLLLLFAALQIQL